MATRVLQDFAPHEFRNWDLVEQQAADALQAIREAYGRSLTLTSDARTPAENAAASGSSPTSLHLLGRAFDLRWISDPISLWRFVAAVFHVAVMQDLSVELELVHSATDQHIHLGFYPTQRPSQIIVRAD